MDTPSRESAQCDLIGSPVSRWRGTEQQSAATTASPGFGTNAEVISVVYEAEGTLCDASRMSWWVLGAGRGKGPLVRCVGITCHFTVASPGRRRASMGLVEEMDFCSNDQLLELQTDTARSELLGSGSELLSSGLRIDRGYAHGRFACRSSALVA